MTIGDNIDINGVWTSKDGRNKIQIIQSLDKFEGYIGNPEEVKISLGTVSKRTLNFKQTWHEGVNKGAVATVYGKLSNDNGTIILDFEGTRANGRPMKGRNVIYRESLVGTWIPMGLGRSGDVWRFMLDSNRRDITGYFIHTRLGERVELRGQMNFSDNLFFIISLPSKEDGRVEIQGEFRCPNIVLTLPPDLGNKTILLERKSPAFPTKFEEYEPASLMDDSSTTSGKPLPFSLSPQKQPFRGESEVVSEQLSKARSTPSSMPEDLRTTLLFAFDVPKRRQTHCECCCCNVQ